MPSIGLAVLEPQTTFRRGGFGTKGWRLTFETNLANAYTQTVELTTEEKFTDLHGTLAFEDADTSEAYYGHEHGTLSYWKGSYDGVFPDPPSYLVTIRLPSADLERLQATIAAGLPLRSINVTCDGLTHGWEPDGSGKKWDNTAKPQLEINGYMMFFGKSEEEEFVPDPPEPAVDTDANILESVRSLGRTMSYTLFAIVFLVVIIIVKRD